MDSGAGAVARISLQAVEVVSEIAAIPAILAVVCKSTGMRFAAVARVTEDRWIACQVRDEAGIGLAPGSELDADTTVCKEARDAQRSIVISDLADDPAYVRHPLSTTHGFRSHVTTPIVLPDGQMFGTLCAMDREPRDLTSPWLVEMFELFAELIALHLDTHMRLATSTSNLADTSRDLATSRRDLATSAKRLTSSRANLATSRAEAATSAASLLDERAGSELREQFIAVLGHDLRNPLASISAGAKLLRKESLSERGRNILVLVEQSVARMAALIDDVLDFARGRLGGGIGVDAARRVPLAPMLRQVVSELQSSNPDRDVQLEMNGITDCRCDPGRIGQLLSNLVANALTHGAPNQPIRVSGINEGASIRLSVTNGGDPIPPATMDSLFKPFVRASARPSQQGLGLGLYIAAEIAKAHGGTLGATSDDHETTFTFQMPN